jgi:rhamnose utilization protein RhaD (predicted bifunctional aldolase and dehydrogenase)
MLTVAVKIFIVAFHEDEMVELFNHAFMICLQKLHLLIPLHGFLSFKHIDHLHRMRQLQLRQQKMERRSLKNYLMEQLVG